MPDTLTPAPAAAVAVARPSTPDSGAALLDAEKLHVYRLAVEFQTLAARLVPRQRGVLLATLRDQLDRASVSIVLNIAEGAGDQWLAALAAMFSVLSFQVTECSTDLNRREGE